MIRTAHSFLPGFYKTDPLIDSDLLTNLLIAMIDCHNLLYPDWLPWWLPDWLTGWLTG